MRFNFAKAGIAGCIALFIGFSACRQSVKPSKNMKLEGKTMGTTYHASYVDSLHRNFQVQFDSILHAFNHELSTYDTASLISRFNRDTALTFLPEHQHFVRTFQLAQRVYRESQGWFDPTVKPLVNYWGFGYQEKRPIEQVDSAVVDSLLGLLGMDKIELVETPQGKRIRKSDRRIQLDVNAIAPGDAADILGVFLESKGIFNYMIEIGGELRARGTTEQGKPWRVGINTPVAGAETDDFQAVVELSNRGLATSGNYRSFYEKDGKRYTHTINPKTGYTEQNTLLSATILAPNAALADAYATACMAMGVDSAYAWVQTLKEVDAYFIYAEGNEMKERATNGMPFVE